MEKTTSQHGARLLQLCLCLLARQEIEEKSVHRDVQLDTAKAGAQFAAVRRRTTLGAERFSSPSGVCTTRPWQCAQMCTRSYVMSLSSGGPGEEGRKASDVAWRRDIPLRKASACSARLRLPARLLVEKMKAAPRLEEFRFFLRDLESSAEKLEEEEEVWRPLQCCEKGLGPRLQPGHLCIRLRWSGVLGLPAQTARTHWCPDIYLLLF